jgi:hypothetical protein
MSSGRSANDNIAHPQTVSTCTRRKIPQTAPSETYDCAKAYRRPNSITVEGRCRAALDRAAVGAGSLGDGGGGLVFLLGLVVASSVATSCGGTGGKRSVLRSATPG